MKQCKPILIATALLFTAGNSLAETSTLLSQTGSVNVSTILHVLMVLIAIIGFILVAAYVVKRTSFVNKNHAGSIKILTGLSIGSRDKLLLIKAGDQELLLGVSPGRIQTLHTFKDASFAEQAEQSNTNFVKQLKLAIMDRGQ